MRGAVTDFLTDFGFQVETASTYAAAKCHLNGNRFRLLVADLAIPRESDEDSEPRLPLGLDIVKEVKSTTPDCGVVVWSAYTHYLPDIMALISDGRRGLAYVAKGSRASTLREAIRQALNGDVFLHGGAISSQPLDVERQFLAALPAETAGAVKHVAALIPNLTPRQRQVVERFTVRPEVIAAELGVSVHTIRNYQDAIYEKLDLRDSLSETQKMRRDALIVLAVLLQRLHKEDNDI